MIFVVIQLVLSTFGTTSMLASTDKELNVWKNWFLKVANPPWSTGMRRPHESREMKIATGNETSLKTDVTPVGKRTLMENLTCKIVPCKTGIPSSKRAAIEWKQSRTSPWN